MRLSLLVFAWLPPLVLAVRLPMGEEEADEVHARLRERAVAYNETALDHEDVAVAEINNSSSAPGVVGRDVHMQSMLKSLNVRVAERHMHILPKVAPEVASEIIELVKGRQMRRLPVSTPYPTSSWMKLTRICLL